MAAEAFGLDARPKAARRSGQPRTRRGHEICRKCGSVFPAFNRNAFPFVARLENPLSFSNPVTIPSGASSAYRHKLPAKAKRHWCFCTPARALSQMGNSLMSVSFELAQPESDVISIRPLQPTIGAEIGGVDLRSPLPEAVRDAIRAAVIKYKVVFFRDQPITREQQSAFAREFGPLYTHPTTRRPEEAVLPAVHHIVPIDRLSPEDSTVRYGTNNDQLRDGYHTDTSWRLVPAWGAVLRPIHLPEVGGDTIWVDAHLAYQGLPESVKVRLDGLHVTHDFRHSLLKAGHDYPVVAHKVIRTHRETDQHILWVNFTQKPNIIGLDRAENAELLTIILDQYRRPENQVRFSWRPGSLAFWDNRSTVHYAVRNYGDFPRLMERVLIADEPQYADL
jgi:taurine dioxygenase